MSAALDRPIWSALASRQTQFDTSGVLARRFPTDVSSFAAARDASGEAVAALTALAMQDEISLVETAPPPVPAGLAQVSSHRLVQMIAPNIAAGGRGLDEAIEALGESDAADMLALATLTRPGPFRARTHRFGRFLGIRDCGRLVAMGGERLALEGFTEVSALCTHPDYRGRGFGEALLRRLCARILSEGDIPFLHSYPDNVGAIALYHRMGFRTRAHITYVNWTRA